MSDRLFISFSGGRTSAFMTKVLLDQHKDDREIVVLFANTGLEHDKTLEFVRRCDEELGFPTVWVEAVVDPAKGSGTSFKVVDFQTADRKGKPFEAVIAKYGVPNKGYPHCTRETKLVPMTKYLRSIGWGPGSYSTAVGIRTDEKDRKSRSAMSHGVFYPLSQMGITKDYVRAWWGRQSFDLEIPEHYGNCLTCWKKSLRKLLTVATEMPDALDWNERMEADYGMAGAGVDHKPRKFFRDHRSTQDIRHLATQPFEPFTEVPREAGLFDEFLDVGGACGDGCEIGADED